MNKAFSFIGILLIALVSEGVFATTTTLTVDVDDNRIVASGIPAIRETVTLIITNAGSLTAGNLKFAVLQDDTIYAQAEDFVYTNGAFRDSLDLNTVALTNFFEPFEDQSKRQFTVTLWDRVNYRLVFNDKLNIQNNPYVTGMSPATAVSNDYNAKVEALIGQTSVWNQASTDASSWTNFYTGDWITYTNAIEVRIDAVEGRTSTWNTAATDATSWTNWAATHTTDVQQAVTDATAATNFISTNVFGTSITTLEGFTSTWNTASVDASASTNFMATNTFGAQLSSLEGRTGTWNTASTDSIFSTNWIATNVLDLTTWSQYPATQNVNMAGWSITNIATNSLSFNDGTVLSVIGGIFQITATNSTYLGGTIAASWALDSEVTSATNDNYIALTNWVTDQAYLTNEALWIAASNGVAYLAAENIFTWGTNTFDGYVGIGTNKPVRQLHVASSGLAARIRLDCRDNAGITGFEFRNGAVAVGSFLCFNTNYSTAESRGDFEYRTLGDQVFYAGGSASGDRVMWIKDGGMVGIMTNGPSAPLDVASTNATGVSIEALGNITVNGDNVLTNEPLWEAASNGVPYLATNNIFTGWQTIQGANSGGTSIVSVGHIQAASFHGTNYLCEADFADGASQAFAAGTPEIVTNFQVNICHPQMTTTDSNATIGVSGYYQIYMDLSGDTGGAAVLACHARTNDVEMVTASGNLVGWDASTSASETAFNASFRKTLWIDAGVKLSFWIETADNETLTWNHGTAGAILK